MALSRLSIISIFFLTPACGVLGGGGGAFLVEVVLLRGGELGESMVGAHRRNYARKAVAELVAAISARDILPCNVTATLCLRARGFGVHTRSSTGVNW